MFIMIKRMLQGKKYTETTNQHPLQHNWYCVEGGG